jgi:hypothetical protein
MRQYAIFYRRGTGKWGRLEPNTHYSLYSRPEVSAAVAFMQAVPSAEGVALRLGDERFNLTAFEPGVEDEQAFTFPGETT